MNNQYQLDVIGSAIKNLADSILEEKFLDKEKITLKAEAFVTSAIQQLLNEAMCPLEQQAFELKKNIAAGKYNYSPQVKQSKMMKLGAINDEIKKYNRARHSLKDYSDYGLLKVFIVNKFGNDALKEYFDMQIDAKVEMYKPSIEVRAKELIPKSKRKTTLVYSFAHQSETSERSVATTAK